MTKKKQKIKISYPTYKQAKQAVKRLKIKAQVDYYRHYKKDKKLPLHPDRTYAKKGWKDWYDFFGKKIPNFYKKYSQAAQSAQRLGFSSQSHYKRSHHRDLRLPSHPDEHYRRKGWTNWYNFLGKSKKRSKR